MLSGCFIFFYLLLIAPVQAGIRIRYDRSPDGLIGLRIWGIGLQVPLSLSRDENGQLHLESSLPWKKKKKKKKEKPGGLRRLFTQAAAVIRADKARKLLQWGVTLESLKGEIHLHLENAAHTALLSSLCQLLSTLPEKARIHVFPSFSGPGRLHLQCIVRFRLGTLLTACAMGFLSYRLQRKKEDSSWNIPSDA